MLITVIVPSHRSAIELKEISESFKAQKYPNKRLVIIENGSAIGTCKKYNVHVDAVLSSEHSKSVAFNVGLEWLRNHGGGAWAAWDDDDYYGPEYLTEVSIKLKNYDIIGKSSIYVRRNDGRLWLVERKAWPLGHSFAGWSDCCNFKHYDKWGEDDQFLHDMLKSGAKLGDMSPNNFVWQRSGDLSKHIWPANDEQMAQILTLNREHSSITDYGYIDNYELVDRPDKRPEGNKIILSEFDPLDVPGIPERFKKLFRKHDKVERYRNCSTNSGI